MDDGYTVVRRDFPRFPPTMESDYQAEYFRGSIKPIRIGLIVLAILNVGVLDPFIVYYTGQLGPSFTVASVLVLSS